MLSAGFPDEATLHALIEEAPQLLPFSGSPDIVVVGREVTLGSSSADLIGVESSGCLVVIEVKLERRLGARSSPRSSRTPPTSTASRSRSSSVMSSVLICAPGDTRAYPGAFETADRQIPVDRDAFDAGLLESLSTGRFRLVLVLDDAPADLIRLVGYLGAIGDNLVLDLVTAASYDVGGSRIIVPQRVEPERVETETKVAQPRPAGLPPEYLPGSDVFEASIPAAPESTQPTLRKLFAWATGVRDRGLASLLSVVGTSGRWILQVRLADEPVSLIAIYNENSAYISFFRTVFERRAPKTLVELEQFIAPTKVGQGNITRDISDGLLAILTRAYEEAATR